MKKTIDALYDAAASLAEEAVKQACLEGQTGAKLFGLLTEAVDFEHSIRLATVKFKNSLKNIE